MKDDGTTQRYILSGYGMDSNAGFDACQPGGRVNSVVVEVPRPLSTVLHGKHWVKIRIASSLYQNFYSLNTDHLFFLAGTRSY